MSVWRFLGHPLWSAVALVLALVLRARRRARWEPRSCPVELRGKTAIVTGANTGIGYHIALDLARRGARVILACRCPVRGGAARDRIEAESGNAQVVLRLLDLSSMDSVRDFAQTVIRDEGQLHLLVNNAGVSGLPRKMTADGFDMMFATNHLGPFLLTNLLLDLLKRSTPSRIVILASSNHSKGKIDFSHFKGENLVYAADRVYNHTKLHNLMWSRELAHRLEGTGVSVNSVHPGYVMTEVLRHYPLKIKVIFNLIGFFFFKTPEEGAVAPLYCAVSEEMEAVTGKYINSDCSLTLPAPNARDSALGREGFETCLKLTSNL